MIFFIVFTFQKSGEKCLEIWWVLQCAGACSAFTCWWYPRHCEGTHRAPKTIFSLRGLSYLLVRNVKRLLSIKRFLQNLFSLNERETKMNKTVLTFYFLATFSMRAHSKFHSESSFQRGSQFDGKKKVSLVFLCKCKFFYNSSRMYFGFNSSIRLMKSPFSRQPSQPSSQSLRIFFKSRTLSFLRSTLFKSICFSTK